MEEEKKEFNLKEKAFCFKCFKEFKQQLENDICEHLWVTSLRSNEEFIRRLRINVIEYASERGNLLTTNDVIGLIDRRSGGIENV